MRGRVYKVKNFRTTQSHQSSKKVKVDLDTIIIYDVWWKNI